MQLSSVHVGDLVEVTDAPGGLRHVSARQTGALITHELRDRLYEGEGITSTSRHVIAHYRKLATKGSVQPGDVICADRNGLFFAVVLAKGGRELSLRPLSNVRFFSCTTRQLRTVYRPRRAAPWLASSPVTPE